MTNLIQRVGSIRRGPLVALLVAAFSVHAIAQFEIAPDHFDSNTSVEKKRSAKPATAKPRAQAAASPANAAKKAQGSVVARSGQPGTTSVAGSGSSAASNKSTTKKEAARRKKRAAETVAQASTH